MNEIARSLHELLKKHYNAHIYVTAQEDYLIVEIERKGVVFKYATVVKCDISDPLAVELFIELTSRDIDERYKAYIRSQFFYEEGRHESKPAV